MGWIKVLGLRLNTDDVVGYQQCSTMDNSWKIVFHMKNGTTITTKFVKHSTVLCNLTVLDKLFFQQESEN